MSVFSEGNTVHLCLTFIPVRANKNLFNAAKEYKCVSLEKPKANPSLNLYSVMQPQRKVVLTRC